jgi:hypothetical protein
MGGNAIVLAIGFLGQGQPAATRKTLEVRVRVKVRGVDRGLGLEGR